MHRFVRNFHSLLSIIKLNLFNICKSVAREVRGRDSSGFFSTNLATKFLRKYVLLYKAIAQQLPPTLHFVHELNLKHVR